MEIFSRSSLFILVLASLVQTIAIFGNPTTKTTVKTTTAVTTPAGFLSSPEPPIKVSLCPRDATIFPCRCQIEQHPGAALFCAGSLVNESSIENTFREIRKVNGIPEDRGISIYYFRVDSTQLTQLDLAPFYGSQIEYLQIWVNHNLTKLVTSGNPRDHGSIQVDRLDISSSPLTRTGFGEALKFFSNEMTSFDAKNLNLKDDDSSEEDEFLPGLSALTNLRFLSFYNSSISGRLTSDTLIPKELQNLEQIDLKNNSINEIGENVFDFEGSGDVLEIDLDYNNLNESSFHPNSGIARVGRKTRLILYHNPITTLPAPTFETFLDANKENSLALIRNPLICDERVSWLKSRREEFEPRVKYADCSNDPGHTVFDSDLIP